MTQVIVGRPPNFDQILKVFPRASRPGIVFAYGNAIYAGNRNLPPSILDHEGIHCARQMLMGVENWWDRYLASPAFRLDEEIPAHRSEYENLVANGNRNMRRKALAQIANKLAAPLYGNLVTVAEAKRLIGRGDANL